LILNLSHHKMFNPWYNFRCGQEKQLIVISTYKTNFPKRHKTGSQFEDRKKHRAKRRRRKSRSEL